MRFKFMMILTIVLTFLLVVSAVSATENATDDIVSADASDDVVSVEETTDEVVSVENDNQVITEGNDSDVGSFADLQTEINNVEEGGVLNLTKDYKYVNGSTEGISINKAITINGQGHTIDGNQLSRSFYINANNVVLNNINFLNSKIKSDGGAVYWVGNNGVLDNCDFINCSNLFNPNRDNYYGGAIYWNGFNATISYCNFINNTAWCTAGVYISGYSENCSISYCNFINNTALYVAAIDWVDSIYGFIDCCNFINNNAEFSGIVQTSSSEYISITSCNFEENKVTNNDGVLNDCVDNSYIFNCTFKNNLAYNGGGISSSGGTNKRIIKCIFENNQANYGGGGFYAYSLKDSIFDNCTFINNSAKNFGGAFCLYLSKNVNIQNSIFINNSVNSNVNSIYFGESTSGTVENTYFNPNFGNVIEDSELILIRGSAFLDCDDLTFDYKNNVTWELSLKNSLNLYLDNQSIKCYLNLDGSEIFSLITDDKGIARASNELSNLNAGTWNVTVIFEGDDNYAPCNATATITVLPPSSSVTMDDVNATVGHEVSFVANVNSSLSVNEGYVVFFDGETQIGEAPVTNGTAILTYTPTTDGEHAITAIFNSTNYLSSNSTAKLSIDPVHLDIQTNMATVGYETNLIANVYSINGGIVLFYDGGNYIGEANVVEGVATLSYTPTTAGEHIITAFYTTNDYQSSNATANLSVSRANVDLSVDYIESVYFNTPSNFAVNVNSNYKPVNEGEIKFYVNDVLVGFSNIYNGKANFNYVANTTGSFILTAVFNETGNYLAADKTTYFDVNQMPTTLTGESIIFDEQAYKTFTTELKDNNNNGVNGKPVKIEVIKYSGESATFNGISDSNGITIYDVGNLAGGMWYVTGIYAGDQDYLSSRFADKFIVVRMDTTTAIEEIQNPQVNHNYKLKANIHDENGKLVKEGIVQFYLDGVDIGSIDLSKNQGHQNALGNGVLGAVNPMFDHDLGVDNLDVYLNYVPTTVGKHNLTAVYEGTTLYRSSNSTTLFEVANSNTKETTITANGFTTVYNGGKNLVITLKDVTGKPVSGVKVTIVLGGKTYTPNTDKNGQVKVTTNGLKPVKKYTATITFKGNSKYDKSSTTAKIKVNKAYPKFKYSAATFKRTDKKKKYTIRFLTNQNTAMKYAKVYIKVNKKVYAAKTNKKGFATFKLTKLTKKGKYTANIIFKGDGYYNKLTKNVKIKVR